jgi:hypothetical protein
VDRTGADNDQEPLVVAAKDGPRFLASPEDGFRLQAARRQLFLDLGRGYQPGNPANAKIFHRSGGAGGGSRF